MHCSDNQPVDHANDAPEVDLSCQSPVPYPFEEGKQVRYGNARLEPESKKSPLYVVAPDSQSNTLLPWRDRLSKRIVLVVAILCTILAIALGVGLGIGLGRHSALPSSAAPTSTLTSSNSTISPPLKNGILEDTSLAAIATSGHSRHVFFQDFNQSLRHASYNIAGSIWLDGADFIYTDELPQNHTPLAAVLVMGIKDGNETHDNIHLFYINRMGFLTAVTQVYGQSYGEYSTIVLMNDSFPTALGSRTLSVTQLSWGQAGVAEALLMYEAPTGNITVLHGYYSGISGTSQWLWQNVSDAVYTPLANNGTWLQPPLASNLVSFRATNICFLDPRPRLSTTTYTVSCVLFQDWYGLLPNASQPEVWSQKGTNSDQVLEEDVICWSATPLGGPTNHGASWVEDSTLLLPPNPHYSYPFGRLASMNDSRDDTLFVYHQLTDSILAEDQYYASAGWTTTNITIEASKWENA